MRHSRNNKKQSLSSQVVDVGQLKDTLRRLNLFDDSENDVVSVKLLYPVLCLLLCRRNPQTTTKKSNKVTTTTNDRKNIYFGVGDVLSFAIKISL